MLLHTFKHLFQLDSKFVVNEEVDEEVGQVVDVERVAEVAANWTSKVYNVHRRDKGDDESDKNTRPNFHGLHVTRILTKKTL